jgi:hypothetical protein
LIGKAQAPDWRGNRDAQFYQTVDPRRYEINLSDSGWPKIDFYGLPGPGSIQDSDLNAHGVRLFHMANTGLNSKREFIETEAQRLGQLFHASRARSFDSQVHILCRASALCKPQFHRNAALEVVGVQEALLKRPFEGAAEGEEGDPSPQAFLIEALFPRDPS